MSSSKQLSWECLTLGPQSRCLLLPEGWVSTSIHSYGCQVRAMSWYNASLFPHHIAYSMGLDTRPYNMAAGIPHSKRFLKRLRYHLQYLFHNNLRSHTHHVEPFSIYFIYNSWNQIVPSNGCQISLDITENQDRLVYLINSS